MHNLWFNAINTVHGCNAGGPDIVLIIDGFFTRLDFNVFNSARVHVNELPLCAKSWEVWGVDAVDELRFIWVNIFQAICAVHGEKWATRRVGSLETAMCATFRIVKLSCNNFAPAFPEVCHC